MRQRARRGLAPLCLSSSPTLTVDFGTAAAPTPPPSRGRLVGGGSAGVAVGVWAAVSAAFSAGAGAGAGAGAFAPAAVPQWARPSERAGMCGGGCVCLCRRTRHTTSPARSRACVRGGNLAPPLWLVQPK